MKKLIDKKSLKLGVTIFLLVSACITFFFLIFKMDFVLSKLSWFLKILKPFLLGFVFAYLLNPAVEFFKNKVFKKIMKNSKIKKKESVTVLLSILSTYIIAIIFAVIFFSIIIPELLHSLEIFIRNIPVYLEQTKYYLLNSLKNHEQLEKIVLDNYNEINVYLQSVVNNTFLPKIEQWVVIFSNGLFAAFNVLYTIIIGFIVSIYYLFDKEVFISQLKKMLYGVLPIKKANDIIDYFRYADQVFGGFLMGKILASSVLFAATLIFVTMFDFPFKMLIAALIGVTNVVPYFGPFVGGILSAVIILLQAPSKFWLIVVFVIVIQQIDGNFLTPKFTGVRTGIKSFWVLFSIIVFGGMFGVIGMIVGVPIFALIYAYVKNKLNNSLISKDLPTETEMYINLDRINSSSKKVITK